MDYNLAEGFSFDECEILLKGIRPVCTGQTDRETPPKSQYPDKNRGTGKQYPDIFYIKLLNLYPTITTR